MAYESYTHFTSPIRRYPDLLIHRAIKAVLNGEKYRPGDWHMLGEHCSMTERRADDATRDVVAWLKCFYMQDKIGEEFEGTVSGVTGFGLFVALDGVYVEGLLHVTELGNDYFNYDKARHEMIGERTGVRYRLGDRLHVKVSRVDLETSKIDFMLVADASNFAVYEPPTLKQMVRTVATKVARKTAKTAATGSRKIPAGTKSTRKPASKPPAKAAGKSTLKKSTPKKSIIRKAKATSSQ